MLRTRVYELDIGPADVTVDVTEPGFGTPKFAIMVAVNNDAGADTTYRRDMVGFVSPDFPGGISVSYSSEHNVSISNAANGVQEGIHSVNYNGTTVAFQYVMSSITDGYRFTRVTNSFGGSKRFWVYVVWGDSVLNTKITQQSSNAASGSITGVGFKPNWAMVVSGSTTVGWPTLEGGNARGMSVGIACLSPQAWYPGTPSGVISQGVSAMYERDGSGTSATANFSQNGRVAHCQDPSNILTWSVSLSSFDADGLSWTRQLGNTGGVMEFLLAEFDTDDIDLEGFNFHMSRNSYDAAPATQETIAIGWPCSSFLSFCNLSPDQAGTVATTGSYPGVMNYSMGANFRTFCCAGYTQDGQGTTNTGGAVTPSAENFHLELWDNRGVAIFDGYWDCGGPVEATPQGPGHNLGGSWRLTYLNAPAFTVAYNTIMIGDQYRMVVANGEVVGNILDGAGNPVTQIKADGIIYHGDRV